MKILITGSSSDERTRITNSVKHFLLERGVRAGIVEETFPQSLQLLCDANEPLAEATLLVTEQIRAETSAQQSHDDVLICNGGLTDIYAYLVNIMTGRQHAAEFLRIIRDISVSWSETYELTFWIAQRNSDGDLPRDELLAAEESYADSFIALRIMPQGFSGDEPDRVSTIVNTILEFLASR